PRCRHKRLTPPLTLAFLLGKYRVFHLRRTTRGEHAVEPAGLQDMHGGRQWRLTLELALQHLQGLWQQSPECIGHAYPQLLSATVQRCLKARVMVEPLTYRLPGHLDGCGGVSHRLAAG